MSNKNPSIKKYEYYIIAGDIGGTNSRFGVFGIEGEKPMLLNLYTYRTKKIKSIYKIINDILQDAKNMYHAEINNACFGFAGLVSPKRYFSKLTNAKISMDVNKIKKKCQLKNIILVNDFEALGYGVNLLKKSDIVVIKKGAKFKNFPAALIGAGTGLGKATLIYDKHIKLYVPISSEGGHSDFPLTDDLDFKIAAFIRIFRKIKSNIFIEDLVSGRGIENIYYFLKNNGRYKQSKYQKLIENAKLKPELISKYKKNDKLCKDTFLLFSKYYARAIRNFALEIMALGGIYIGGGIATNNQDIFNREFINEFENNEILRPTLKEMPIYLIKSRYAGLTGAAFAAIKGEQ